MNKKIRLSLRCLISLAALLMVAGAGILPASASGNLRNAYVGASVGRADLQAKDWGLLDPSVASLGSFDLGNFAYQLFGGVRWSNLLEVEVDYFNLGSGGASPSLSFSPSLPSIYFSTTRLTSAHISQKGEAVFAMLYLPVSIVNVHVKAGVARVTTDLEASTVPPPVRRTSFARPPWR